LNNRKHRVTIQGQSSEEADIIAGVPQGSILGPLFFLVYMNDLPESLNIDLMIYADDVTVYIDYNNYNQAKRTLEDNIERLTEWAERWNMQFNPTKTEQLNISRKKNHIPIEIRTTEGNIEIVKSHKHLGVVLQKDGKWTEHIEYVVNRTSRRLDILRSNKYILDKKSLEKLYMSYIRPILEYSSQVWCNISKQDKEKLEGLQREAMRTVTGAKKGTSHQALAEEVGWQNLNDRRVYHCLCLMFKIVHGNAPLGLIEMLPENKAHRNPYNIRSATDLDIPKSSTEQHADSFFPNVSRLWNELPQDVKDIPSLEEFQREISPEKFKPPTYYDVGNRRNQILITRLRVKNADLKQNLCNRNMEADPVCECGVEEESTEHYLLHCTLYQDHRNTLTQNIGIIPLPITEDLLLKGSDLRTEATNVRIIKATQNYISSSGRFK
jgi:hypothetical protein